MTNPRNINAKFNFNLDNNDLKSEKSHYLGEGINDIKITRVNTRKNTAYLSKHEKQKMVVSSNSLIFRREKDSNDNKLTNDIARFNTDRPFVSIDNLYNTKIPSGFMHNKEKEPNADNSIRLNS